jgi:hypothetical protein
MINDVLGLQVIEELTKLDISDSLPLSLMIKVFSLQAFSCSKLEYRKTGQPVLNLQLGIMSNALYEIDHAAVTRTTD